MNERSERLRKRRNQSQKPAQGETGTGREGPSQQSANRSSEHGSDTERTPDEGRVLRFVPAFDEQTVRPLVRALIGLAGLLVILGLMAVLPAIDQLVSALAVPPMALLVTLATLLAVGALLLVAPAVKLAVAQGLAGHDEIDDHAAASAMYLVAFVAVGIAYRGFAMAITPVFEAFDIGGLYHLVFLTAGLLALALIARHLSYCWAPVTDLLTDYVTNTIGQPRHDTSVDD